MSDAGRNERVDVTHLHGNVSYFVHIQTRAQVQCVIKPVAFDRHLICQAHTDQRA